MSGFKLYTQFRRLIPNLGEPSCACSGIQGGGGIKTGTDPEGGFLGLQPPPNAHSPHLQYYAVLL